ncbi:MAG TPA: D-alanyl-D-alanine carboxypeptidase/D-alanyl-D-alanine-endopeptidase [Paenalcaligenes sp.]|nr:D-alanyl-D-alanine carboxypeptidase/D-alanyl-D-alanine-endopeptidase [Paenalcaligenes sp.]
MSGVIGKLWCRSRVALFLIVFTFWGSVSQAQIAGLPSELAPAWKATGLADSSLSLVVQEVDGQTLIRHNGTLPRNPASVMKLVTTWGGLSSLGPEYTWRTSLMAQGGGIVDAQGTLQGPLYIKASGDPFLTLPDLWSLLRDLRLRGIKNVGEVIVDRSVFGQVAIDPWVFDNAGDRPYNASPDAAVVALGASRIVFQPDPRQRRWISFIDPPLPGVRIDGEVEWTNAVCPGSPNIGTSVRTEGRGVVINVSGKAAGSCGEFSVYRLTHSQDMFFQSVFKSIWKELGGTLARDVRSGVVPANATPIVWHDSRPLAEHIRTINKQSNNLMATLLLLTIGSELNGKGAVVATAENALLRILNQQGINTQGWRIDNGSGLSRVGRVTADGLAGMLTVAWRSNYMPEFMSSLAISGVDGTVRRRLRDDDVAGRAHLKTGTLRDARALAGYVLGASGKRYILVSMVNDTRSSAVRSFDDALVKWLANQ